MQATEVTLRQLQGAPDEIAELQGALEGAPTYSQLITGSLPGPSDARSTCSALPPNKTYADKFVFGIYANARCVGCIDLIRAYPTSDTAMLGLLLVAEQFHGQGIGRRAFELVEIFIRSWGTCNRVRIGVVETNRRTLPFWQSLGFQPTGEIKPYRYASVSSRVVVLERALPDAS